VNFARVYTFMTKAGMALRLVTLVSMIMVGQQGGFSQAGAGGARFCIQKVQNGAPTKADAFDTWRMTSKPHVIPTVPQVAFTPMNRGGAWAINASRVYAPNKFSFPRYGLSNQEWVEDTHNRRIVAATSELGTLVKDKANSDFVVIDSRPVHSPAKSVATGEIVLISGHIAKDGPHVFAVGKNGLTDWSGVQALKLAGIKRVRKIVGSEVLQGDLVFTEFKLWFLAKDGRVQELGQTLQYLGGGEVHELKNGNAAIVNFGGSSTLVVRESAGLRSTPMSKLLKFVDGSRLYPITASNEYLVFGSAPSRAEESWHKILASGTEEIANSATGTVDEKYEKVGVLKDLPSLNGAVIFGSSGLHYYDGVSIREFSGGRYEIVGRWPQIADISSLKRVFAVSERGVFELKPTAIAEKLDVPFQVGGYPLIESIDWPAAGVALFNTAEGLFALDSKGSWESIGKYPLYFGGVRAAVAENPANGDMILNGDDSIYVVIDKLLHTHVCPK
jgi:hypothetical protein